MAAQTALESETVAAVDGLRPRRISERLGFARRPCPAAALPAGMIFGVDDKPSLALTLLAGLQWIGLISVLLVFVLVVLRQGHEPPPTVAAVVGLSMLALSVGALLQALPRGPIGSGFLAPGVTSSTYLGPSLLAIKLGGLPLVFGMTIFAGCCKTALSPFVGRLSRLFPIEIQGLAVFLIGVVVGTVAIRQIFAVGAATPAGPAGFGVAALTFGTTVVLTIWGNGPLRMLALLMAMVVGYAAAAATGMLTLSELRPFGAIPFVAVPHFHYFRFAFSPELTVTFVIAALASTAKTIGILSQCEKLNDAAWRGPDINMLRRGVLADGLTTTISGAVGTVGIDVMPSAAAVPAATGLASRRVAYAIAAILAGMAFLPFVAIALALMPRAVIGGITLFTASLLLINGLQTMASCQLDQRCTVVIGLGIVAGLAAVKYPHLGAGMPLWFRAMTGSPFVLGTLVAMVANLLLPQRRPRRATAAPGMRAPGGPRGLRGWRERHPGGEAVLTLAAAGLTILLWALTPVTTRIAAGQIDGLAIGMFRTVGAGILAIPILLAFRLRPPRDWSQWRLLALSGSTGFIAFPVLFSIGTARTSACHAGLILGMTPLFAGLIGSIAKRSLPRGQWVVGAVIAVAGQIVLAMTATAGAAVGTTGSLSGDALVLAACLALATSFVAGAALTEQIGAWASTFWAILLASIALSPWAVIQASRIAWADLAPQSWVALIHLTLGAGFLAWVAWFWALARGGVARVAVLQFCQPLFSLAFAAVLLAEPLTPPLLLAAAAILCGVVIARRGENAKSQHRPADLQRPPGAPPSSAGRRFPRKRNSPRDCEREAAAKP